MPGPAGVRTPSEVWLVILYCDYEELVALKEGAERLLSLHAGAGVVAAPPEAVTAVESLVPRLTGDLGVPTLAEQARLERAIGLILEHLHATMDGLILARNPADEDAVEAYFAYARVLSVRERLRSMGREMAAMIELMTGQPPTREAARRITFPD